jgi:hypothetical protein
MMEPIRTNRDLYLAVTELTERHQGSTRTLEEYLLALWGAARTYQDRIALTMGEFFSLLAGAFAGAVPPFDDGWRAEYEREPRESGFCGWEARVREQVVDLHEMREYGILDRELIYFGTNSPRGSDWYNFDPCTFLECAVRGTFGGWEPGDDTGRDFVTGEVVVVGDDGRMTSCDPRELLRPIVPMSEISWDRFCRFLDCGQCYE